jgi:hypothetical protein
MRSQAKAISRPYSTSNWNLLHHFSAPCSSSLLFSDISNKLNFSNMQLRIYSVCDNNWYHDPTASYCAPRSNLTGCTDISRATLECFVAHMQIFWQFIDPGRRKHHRSGQIYFCELPSDSPSRRSRCRVALCMHEIHLESKHVQILDRSIIHSVRHHSVLLKIFVVLMRTFVQFKVKALQDTSQNIRRATMFSYWRYFQ